MTPDCPTPEDLLQYLESGSLPHEIELHAATPCHSCQARIRRLRHLIQLLQELRLEPVSEERIRRASKVPVRDGGKGSAVKRFVAELIAASPTLTVPAMRGGATAYQELFRAGSFEIALAHLQNGSLVGQVLPLESETVVREGECALHGEERSHWTTLTSGGEFRFESIGSGDYVLVIETGEHYLVLPDIILRHSE